MNTKASINNKTFDLLIKILMVLVITLTLYPFYYCLVLSFNNGHDTNMGGVYLFPRAFTLANYKVLFADNTLADSFIVTVARTILGVITSILFTSAVAYGLSKRDLMFRRTYMILGIITMYFSGGLIPFYFVLKYLGLINNFLVFIIPSMLGFFNVFLFIAFYRNIPESLKESAKIDGANDGFIFLRIIFPLSMPIIATIGLFNGIGQWNSWFDSQFFTTSPKLKTLQLVLYEIIALAEGQERLKKQLGITYDSMQYTIESVRYATMMLAIGPIIMVYPFAQKYFIKGMMIGAIKG